jgi:hypothetical protein
VFRIKIHSKTGQIIRSGIGLLAPRSKDTKISALIQREPILQQGGKIGGNRLVVMGR